MWPFSRKKSLVPVPTVRCDGIDVRWNMEFHCWEFSTGGVDYTLDDNPVFDPSLLVELPRVTQWIDDLQGQIAEELRKHIEGWCESDDEDHLVGINVSWLLEKGEVDVAYAADEWGDLGVNVVITNGKITRTYAGD